MPTRPDPPIIAGFVQGLLAPLFELIGALLISSVFQISQSFGGVPWYVIAIVALIVIADIVRNIIVGFSHSQFALGSVIGNVLGLLIFFAAINSISHEAAAQSLLLAIALIGSYGFGIYVYLRSRSENQWWSE